jgi:hypothetical protein
MRHPVVNPEKDQLRTLQLFVGAVLLLMVGLGAASIVGSVVGTGSVPGLTAEICVTTSAADGVALRGQSGGTESTSGPRDLHDGIRWQAGQIQLCDPEPDATTRALGVAGLTVWVLAPLVFFGLLWRLLRDARRDGVFADQVPGGLRWLGGFLLGWAALDFVVSGFVNAMLLNRMTDDGVWLFTSDDFPWLLILLGIAFLALERVMAQAVTLREDTEATI